jgi:uridine kinase
VSESSAAPLVSLAGATCTGKSSTARLVAERLGWQLSAGEEHKLPQIASGELFVGAAEGDLRVERFGSTHASIGWS